MTSSKRIYYHVSETGGCMFPSLQFIIIQHSRSREVTFGIKRAEDITNINMGSEQIQEIVDVLIKVLNAGDGA